MLLWSRSNCQNICFYHGIDGKLSRDFEVNASFSTALLLLIYVTASSSKLEVSPHASFSIAVKNAPASLYCSHRQSAYGKQSAHLILWERNTVHAIQLFHGPGDATPPHSLLIFITWFRRRFLDSKAYALMRSHRAVTPSASPGHYVSIRSSNKVPFCWPSTTVIAPQFHLPASLLDLTLFRYYNSLEVIYIILAAITLPASAAHWPRMVSLIRHCQKESFIYDDIWWRLFSSILRRWHYHITQ